MGGNTSKISLKVDVRNKIKCIKILSLYLEMQVEKYIKGSLLENINHKSHLNLSTSICNLRENQ